MNSNLIDLRKQIDQCDEDLVELLAKRFAITAKVGELKQQSNIQSVDTRREEQQFKRIEHLAKEYGINPGLASRLLRNIIDQVVIEHQTIKLKSAAKKLSAKPRVGIIGMGDFGKLASKYLGALCDVSCFDVNTSSDSLAKVVDSEYVILAVPLFSIEEVLTQIKPLLKPSTTLIDVCSVKQQPAKIFSKVLPKHKNVVFTHPLFGPQSAASSLVGHSIIFTNSNNNKAKVVMNFCSENLGLKVATMTAAQHDKLMAQLHALTFFIARGLNNLGLKPSRFQAPSFQMLLDLVQLDQAQSQELFETVECGNNLAHDVRKSLIEVLQKIDYDLC